MTPADASAPSLDAPTPAAPTIFHEPWWLDAATAGRWSQVELTDAGRCVARWPYTLQRQSAVLVSRMPALVHQSGPVLEESTASAANQALRREQLIIELADRLPKTAAFAQSLHHGFTDAIAFQAVGFRVGVQFSMELAPAPEAVLWAGLRDKTRNVIRRSQERNTLAVLDDPAEFVDFYRGNLGDRSSYLPLDRIASLQAAASIRGRGRMRAARDAAGKLVAATFVVDDARASHYFLSTRDPGSSDNGAVSHLLWEAIRESAGQGRVFDFSGIAGEGAARFYTGFGGMTVPRYTIWRGSSWYVLARAASAVLRGDRRNRFAGEHW